MRDVFLKEMENIEPRWSEELEEGAVKADFEAAVRDCDDCWCMHKVRSWLDALEKGENWSLRRKFLE
jgi:hypothetical protein